MFSSKNYKRKIDLLSAIMGWQGFPEVPSQGHKHVRLCICSMLLWNILWARQNSQLPLKLFPGLSGGHKLGCGMGLGTKCSFRTIVCPLQSRRSEFHGSTVSFISVPVSFPVSESTPCLDVILLSQVPSVAPRHLRLLYRRRGEYYKLLTATEPEV